MGLAHSVDQAAKFDLLNGSEIIILAIKPSLCYVVFVCVWWLAILLPLVVLSCLAVQLGWFAPQARLLLVILVAGMVVRLAFALLQWQSRVYILTNLRVLRIRGVMRVEMFQCSLLQVKDVLLGAGGMERFLGLGTLGLVKNSPGKPDACWENIRRAQQVRGKILQAIDSLKGRSSVQDSGQLGPTTILPAEWTDN